MIPHRRISAHGPLGLEDRDNFVRDLVTILTGSGYEIVPTGLAAGLPPIGPPSPREIVVPLDQIKLHCRIEPEATAEDPLLVALEAAAQIHTEKILRKTVDANATENIKLAMLLLIAHWYRNREAIVVGTITAAAPLAYEALLAPERSYVTVY